MSALRSMSFVIVLAVAPVLPAFAEEAPPKSKPTTAPTAKEKCEHGVQKSLCARCNPKLAAVYKAKGDWCGEHQRPESQCALCHPELAKEGVK